MKSITLLTNNLDIGGSQIVLINIANQALLNHYQVNIVSLTNNLFLKERLINSDRLKIYTCTNKNYSNGFFNRLILSFNFFRILIQIKPTILHSHFWQIDISYLLLVSTFTKIKIIHTIHSPGSSYLKQKPLDYLNNFIEERFIRRNNVLVTVVSNEIEYVIRKVLNFKKNCTVIENGINIVDRRDIEIFPSSFEKDNEKIYFIYPARYQESKGHRLLLKAFNKLVYKKPNVILILIGSNLKDNLQTEVSFLNLDNNIIFLDPIVDINKILILSDFGVFPSFYEGQSIALCEMMAIGLPIVASDITGNREVTDNGKAALLYNSDSDDELFHSMIKLINDTKFSNQLSINAKQFILKKYSQNNIFMKYNNIYINSNN
jgi:glycosyltransferase involved in cell wall biosynthesis